MDPWVERDLVWHAQAEKSFSCRAAPVDFCEFLTDAVELKFLKFKKEKKIDKPIAARLGVKRGKEDNLSSEPPCY